MRTRRDSVGNQLIFITFTLVRFTQYSRDDVQLIYASSITLHSHSSSLTMATYTVSTLHTHSPSHRSQRFVYKFLAVSRRPLYPRTDVSKSILAHPWTTGLCFLTNVSLSWPSETLKALIGLNDCTSSSESEHRLLISLGKLKLQLLSCAAKLQLTPLLLYNPSAHTLGVCLKSVIM
jgi:hypothetical protein